MQKSRNNLYILFLILGICFFLSGTNSLNSQTVDVGPFDVAERHQISPCPGEYPGFAVKCIWGRGLCEAGAQIPCPQTQF